MHLKIDLVSYPTWVEGLVNMISILHSYIHTYIHTYVCIVCTWKYCVYIYIKYEYFNKKKYKYDAKDLRCFMYKEDNIEK